MNDFVLSEARVIFEGSAAFFTLEGLLAGVGDAVLSQDRKLGEGSAAVFTLVWFLSLVSRLVLGEVSASLEGFAALFTWVGSCGRVDDVVLVEDGGVFKGFPTVFASMGLVCFVHPEVLIRSRATLLFLLVWLLFAVRALTDGKRCVLIKVFYTVVAVGKIPWGEQRMYNFMAKAMNFTRRTAFIGQPH